MPISKLMLKTDSEFIEIVKNNFSIKEVQNALGYKSNSGVIFYQIKDRIKELNITTSHFGIKRKDRLSEKSRKFSLDEILVENSSYKNIYRLKLRLVSENIIEYKCDCGITDTWNNQTITLQLDHKNGNPSDHRVENLRFMCPNCHSQTSTFCGRNR